MNLIQFLKGVFRKMVSPKTVAEVLHISPTISTEMKEHIELWEQMYGDRSPWLNESVHSLGLAPLIASEKARMATLEMEVKISGEGERAGYIGKQFQKVTSSIRKNLEYGIALGGIVVKPYVVKAPDDKYKIEFNYTKATNFYPLGFSAEGDVIDAAFVDRVITKEFVYSKVEHHKLVGTTVTVENLAFKKDNSPQPYTNDYTELGYPIALSEVPEWAELERKVELKNIDRLLFAYFKMPNANNIDLDSPLGVSGFSRAVDLIRDADEQYGNLRWEFEGGQLAVDVDRTAFNVYKDAKGNDTYTLPRLQERLFRRTLDLGKDEAYNVFSPALRDVSILNGLNSILVQIENVCDMSRGSLANIQYTEARTATEIKILKQKSYAANCDIQKELEKVLNDCLAIIDIYCDLYQIVEPGKYEVAYSWDDSIIIDKDAERQIDLIDVEKGLMSKVEYRVKWYGETAAQAEEALKKVEDEKIADIEIQQKAMPQNQTPLQRANESDKVTSKI